MEGFAAEGKPLIEALTDGSGMLHKLQSELEKRGRNTAGSAWGNGFPTMNIRVMK